MFTIFIFSHLHVLPKVPNKILNNSIEIRAEYDLSHLGSFHFTTVVNGTLKITTIYTSTNRSTNDSTDLQFKCKSLLPLVQSLLEDSNF